MRERFLGNSNSRRVAHPQMPLRRLELQRLDLCVQTAFVSRRLVLVHQTLAGHAVENGYRRLVGIARCLLVAGFNRAHHTLNVGTHHRTHTDIAGASVFCLAGTFFSLGRVRQVSLQKESKIEPVSIVCGLSVVNQQPNEISGKNPVFWALSRPLAARATTE